jgi:hypothetical protein
MRRIANICSYIRLRLRSLSFIKLRELGVNIWFRYVDDTFVTLNVINKEDEILNYLNEEPTIS